MCGIVGLVGARPEALSLRRAVGSLRHRGPDDEGLAWVDDGVFLGHRRLKVIDLSDAGRQPMSNEDGSVWLAYNGEIYNHRELREGLCARGHRFVSRTDTEVILRLYEERKEECFGDLNGMFALALYDARRKQLLLARDRLGIKPLYYHHFRGVFVFASEIKAILATGLYSPEVNWQALYDYFTYLYVPCPDTMFQGIFQVPPAHVLELDLRTNEARLRRYWQLRGPEDPAASGSDGRSDDEAKTVLRELLGDSVRRQLLSDVPLGIFLSGGVDSPLLTAMMAQTSPDPVKTFTIVFREKEAESYDESAVARTVAQRLGTVHHEITVDITEPAEMLSLVDFFDQPFGNPTFYLMYLISKHTRPEVTVALCGAGGDELFAGYPRYRAMGLARWLRWAPRPLLRGARRLLGLASDDYRTMTLRRARQFLDGLDDDFVRQFVNWTYFLDDGQKRSLLTRCQQAEERGNGGFLPSDRIVRRCMEESRIEDPWNRVLQLDLETFLPDNVLEYTDKMSMAVGLEVRVPYLDHRVVEHSLAIPFRRKLRGARSKIVLKEAFADLLPEVCRSAPKKGFNAPLAVWMRDRLDGYFDRCLSRREVEQQGILDWDHIQTLRQQHRTGRYDNSYPLFSIIMFDVWYRKYILQSELPELGLH